MSAITCSGRDFPWSWSLRRSVMLECCPRRLFLYYYGARGGHDADNAPPRVRELHLQKKLFTAEGYWRELLVSTLRKLFFQESGESFERRRENQVAALEGAVWRSFKRDCNAMLREEYRGDHRIPVIDRIYFNDAPAREVFGEVEELAGGFFASAMARENLEKLFAVSPVYRVNIPRPLPVTLGANTLYGVPMAAYRENGDIVYIALGNICDSGVLINCYYALAEYRITPERVRTFFMDCRDGAMELAESAKVNFSSVLDRISADRSLESSFVRDDGMVCETDFPANAEYCKYCSFRSECLYYGEKI